MLLRARCASSLVAHGWRSGRNIRKRRPRWNNGTPWLKAAHWISPDEVRVAVPKAKVLNDERVRFEVAGGNYRLIVSFDFRRQIAFVKFIGTHAAPIVFSRAPDLTSERFVAEGSREAAIELGAYQPSQSMLFYDILVSSADREFQHEAQPDILVSEMTFSLFRLIVLSSLANARSDGIGDRLHPMTLKPERMSHNLCEILTPTVTGHSEQKCFEHFRAQREITLSECLARRRERINDIQFSRSDAQS